MSTTKIHSTCRIANIGPDDAMILAHAANPDGSNFRKGQGVGQIELRGSSGCLE
jgi:hypothetical protein